MKERWIKKAEKKTMLQDRVDGVSTLSFRGVLKRGLLINGFI
jgi:hypothetical protein